MEPNSKISITLKLTLEGILLYKPEINLIRDKESEQDNRYHEAKKNLIEAIENQPNMAEKIFAHFALLVARDVFDAMFCFDGGGYSAKEIIRPALEILSDYDKALLMRNITSGKMEGFSLLEKALAEIFLGKEPDVNDFSYQIN